MLTEPLIAQLTLLALLLPVAIGALAIAGMRGRLSTQRLIEAPQRQVIIENHDLLMILILYLAGLGLGGAAYASLPLEPADHPTHIAIKTLCAQLTIYLLPVGYLLGVVLRRQQGLRAFGFSPVTRSQVKSGILATGLALPVVLSLSTLGSVAMMLLNIPQPKAGHYLLELLSEPDARYAGLMVSLSAVLVAPAVEEILYRGLLQSFLLNLLGPARRWTIIILASFIFAIVHGSSVPPAMLPALFGLGLILGWLYEVTGSLTPSIILHALFNGINLMLASVMMG